MSKRQPIQPLEVDAQGVLRFRGNAIICRLFDEGKIDLNKIASWDVPREDREQLAQLIGYSHSGAGELSYMSDEVLSASLAMHDNGLTEADARLSHNDELLNDLRNGMRDSIAELFGIHPDDLKGRSHG